ncbi:T9SS type A sorting domain-containing protein [Bacteroidota bacterium]
MRTIKTILLLLFSFNSLQAQKEANNWVFSIQNALTFNKSDTCPNPPCFFEGTKIETDEGFSTISDSNGNLLLYSNGIQVWNAKKEIIINGTGLYGHWSATQSSLIIQKPGCKDTFMIFTVDGVGLYDKYKSRGFNYSKVVLNDEYPEGIVIEKNINLLDDCTEKLTGAKNSNCRDYWIIIHEWESNAFHSYLITKDGISRPIVSKVGSKHNNKFNCNECENKVGFMKLSPKSNKIAVSIFCDALIEIFNFDSKTGKISNCILIKDDLFNKIYDLEFSPNGKYLYTYNAYTVLGKDSSVTGIFQYDISSEKTIDILNSRIKINNKYYSAARLQLSKNGIIYISYWNGNGIDVIENPDKKCPECNYKSNAFTLNNNTKGGFPNFISSYFAKNQVSLPDTVVKIDNEISIPINIKLNCSCRENVPDFTYSAEIQFDASFFYPYDSPIITGNTVIDGKRILTLEGEFKPESQETVVAEIPGLVLLGDSMKTPLEINKFEILNTDINIETQDGSLEIYGICQPEISRIKLIEPLQVNLSPNPADMELTLNIKSREKGEHNIFVYNARGIELNNISWQGGSVSKDINIDVSGYPSGLYFVKVQTGMFAEVKKIVVVH